MHTPCSLSLLALSLATVAQAALQIQSLNPGFDRAGKQACISASRNADGAPVVIHDCNTEDVAKHSWDVSLFTKFNTGPQQIKVFGNKCLDVKDGRNADGTKLQIWSCVPGSTNQMWVSMTDFTFQWAGTNKCIDLSNGDLRDDAQLQIWTCNSGNVNQRWQGNKVPNKESGAVKLVGGKGDASKPSLCLTAESNTDGAAVSLSVCDKLADSFPRGNQTWTIANRPLSGPIKTFDGKKCLDVRDGRNANGNRLQVWTCVEGSANQQWKVDSPNSISWAGRNKCVDVTDGKMVAKTPLQIWDCVRGSDNQAWFVAQA
ncbi:hypothetical protein V5O48_018776 [Marasmius crinis-equi]|uniref:Ricin B lectin domain-containing protein n=1 Tax=Marasmius crinis-equi TaxID=585013 RepID=A0ABR3EK77_9AGAR